VVDWRGIRGLGLGAWTGQWLAIATSNFCGPQFVGMWRDKAWHQQLTHTIKAAEIAGQMREGRLYERL
jgi:hypothetical protein